MHVLALDGVYQELDEKPNFKNAASITDEEVACLLTDISSRVRKHLVKFGYLDKDGELVQNPEADSLFQDSESLTLATECSLKGSIAFGPNAGKFRIGSGFGYYEEIPLAKGKRCSSIHGFSIHTNTSINTHRRDRLEQLIEYMARGPLSNDRLEITNSGNIQLRLKRSFSDGTTHLLFTPGEFIEKLIAIIPPPRSHLVKWGGVFAPASPLRRLIILRLEEKKGFDFGAEDQGKNSSWARMLEKVFKIDVLQCTNGRLVPVAAVTSPMQTKRYPKHIGEDYEPPARAPPQLAVCSLEFS